MKKRWWCSVCSRENFFSPCSGCGKSKNRLAAVAIGAVLLLGAASSNAADYFSCSQLKRGEVCDMDKVRAYGYGAGQRVIIEFVAERPGTVVNYPNRARTGVPYTLPNYGEAYRFVYAVSKYTNTAPAHVVVLCGPDTVPTCYGMVATDKGIKRYAR